MALTKVNTDLLEDGGKLDGIEAGADVTDTANVTAAGALMDSELTSIASVKALDQGVATTDSPTFVGLNASGNLTLAGAATFNDLLNIGGSSLNFTKVDGVGINAKESLSITIDSDNNDASRVFSVLDGNGTTLMQVTDAGEATFNQGAVFNEAGVDSDFRVESDGNANMLFVDGGLNKVGIGVVPVQGSLTIKSGGNTYATSALVLEDTDSTTRSYITHVNGDLAISNNGSTDQLVITASGAATFNDNVYVGGDLFVPNLMYHTGDLNTYMQFHGADSWRVVTAGAERLHIEGASVVVNSDGHDADFRVESGGNANMLFVDGGSNTVGIGTTASADETLTVAGEIRATGNDGAVRVDSGSGGYYLNLTQTYAHPYSNSYIQSVAGSSYHGRLVFEGNSSGGSMEEFLRMSTPEGVVFNEDGIDKDFRVESNLQAYMLYVDGGNDIVNFNSTQTTSQQGAGYRLDGFQREFQRDTNVLSVNQSANSNTGARTRRLTIQLHNYGPVKITIMNGGHLYNNGASFGFRETTFYVAMESTSFRINSKVDGVNAGTYASSYGVPTIAAAGSQPRCQIDFTVAAQMTCSTYVKVEGFGTSNIIGIADV